MPETKEKVAPVLSIAKQESIGWLLGRCLILCHKVIDTCPEHEELVKEATSLVKRWEVEKKI